jgi:hemoglobin-like flavoprotein
MLSLSDAVISYTAYCDQLSQLGQLVERVAHKHVSFGVKSEHYPAVGRALLQALEVRITDNDHLTKIQKYFGNFILPYSGCSWQGSIQ